MKATETEVRALWELAFGATYPAGLDIQEAANATSLHKGMQWVEHKLKEMRS